MFCRYTHTHTNCQVELEAGLPRVSRGRRRELAKEEGVEEEEEGRRKRIEGGRIGDCYLF